MKKITTKILGLIFFGAVVAGSFSGCVPRERTLRVYNWGEYMDETVVDSFVDWYAENNDGEKIKVVYKEFTANEDVYTAIATKGESWDLVCPSDYMIERMIDEDLLLEVDKSVVDVSKAGFMDETLLEIFGDYDDGMKYMVPYIWGTFGIMYDTTAITGAAEQKMHSWSALWDSEFSGKIYMKDQERDSYTVAALYHNRNALKAASLDFTDYTTPAYNALMDDIFSVYTMDKINQAKADLIAQKPLLARYESDEGKTEMADGTGQGKLGLFWSCDAGYAINGEDGTNGNKKLKYVVPDEGSNVWVDAWVIPSTAKNTRLANLFLQYLMTDEVCMLNSSYAGAPSANKNAMLELEKEIKADTAFFANTYAGFKEMYLEMMFPTQATLQRCRAMHDFGDLRYEVSEMWSAVRSAA